jgi:hypothetical protein
MTRSRRFRIPLMAVLVTVLFLSVAALATGKPGKPNPSPNPNANANAHANANAVKGTQASAAAKQYGKSRVPICHKGKTIRVAQPAVRAHQRHGDTLGACP